MVGCWLVGSEVGGEVGFLMWGIIGISGCKT